MLRVQTKQTLRRSAMLLPSSSDICNGLLHQPRDRMTVETFPVVDRDQAGTIRAAVLPVLCLRELRNAMCPDEFQVLLDAHPIVEPITPVHPFDLLTRITVALKAEGGALRGFALRLPAFLEEVRTLLVRWPAADA